MIIIRSTQDVAVLWKKTATFTFDPFVENVMKAFGLHASAVDSMFHPDPGHLLPLEASSSSKLSSENPTGKCYFHMQKDWFRLQLHPGENLRALQDKYAYFLSQSITWTSLSDSYVVSSNNNRKVVSLKGFTRQTLGVCAMKAFFGTELFEFSPGFLCHYQDFEDSSWKVFYNYPHFLAKSLHKVKDQAIDDLVKYFALPTEQRPDLAWIFRTMDTELTNLKLDERDRAGMMMMIIWALNHNAHKISFWIFAHVVCDPKLLLCVRSETERAFDASGSLDIDRLLSESPQLDAVWYEVLRIYNNAAIARKATEDTTIRGKSVHAGQTILGPFRQFHMDSDIFGPEAMGFDASRFLETKSLQHTKGYHPFGGGNTYCPGRFFARSEIYIFVATTLHRLDIELASGQKLPSVDLDVPSSSAMPAVEDVLVVLRSRTD
ncbi:MAG: hypothetical protein Q9207_004387 [Kuettlingeria erythrocarpa]